MILHLVTDEQFTDYAIMQFSDPKMQSEFVLIPSNHENWTVKLIDKCTVIEQNTPEFEALLNRLDQYSGIILHGLFWNRWQQPILERVPESVKVAWIFWGGEIYSRSDQYEKFLAPLTKAVYRMRSIRKHHKAYALKGVPLEDFRRIDYCLTDEIEEYEYACRYVGKPYEYLWYNYYSLEETIGSLLKERCSGNNVIVGNSAAAKNNHFDMLWYMSHTRKQLLQSESKVIIPLSYGDPWIQGSIPKFGKMLFGDRQNILDTYMARDEYNAIIQSCSTMILGYTQPAGQGNIITGLWLGMRVYLSEKSMTFQYFKRIGCVVYSLESELKKYGYAPMDDKDVEQNRSVLKEWYSKENMHKRNLEIVKALS